MTQAAEEAIVGFLDALGTLLAGAALLAFAALGLFRFGSRIGVWFSELAAERRRLYWAAIALVVWTVVVAAAAWGVAFVVYVRYVLGQPTTPSDWAGAASVALLLAALAVAVLGGIPWLVLVLTTRVLRCRSRTSGR